MNVPRFGLAGNVFIGFVAGIILGLLFGDWCAALAPISMIFIKIWQITILPAVILSLVAGVGSLKRKVAKDVAIEAGLVLLLFWIIGIAATFSMQLALSMAA